MKTNFRFLALSAAILSMFTACQREELEQNQKPETLTHSVTFVAGAPETKTTVDVSDGINAKFAWTADDEKRISIYENSIAAETVVCGLDEGKMTIMASFKGAERANPSYVALVNDSNSTQIMKSEAYDEDADILVSKVVTEFDGENGVQLPFKREVAIAKMTLKGLDAGEVVNHITVSSTADIAGNYGIEGWTSTQTSLDIYSALAKGQAEGYSIVANNDGNAVVWFTCIPQDNSTLTVQVEANDGNTYRKEFGRGITLSRGNVKSFGVGLQKIQLSEVQNTITWTDYTDWEGMSNESTSSATISLKNKPYGYSVVLTKDQSSSHNPIINSNAKDCRLYANGIIEISNAKPIKKIVFNLSKQGLERLAPITSSVGTIADQTESKTSKQVVWTSSDDNTTSVTFTVGPTADYGSDGSSKAGQLCFSSIDATYLEESIVEPELPQYSIECKTTTGGSLSASETSAHANSQITLTATPEPGYAFDNNWTVTNVETSEPITVTDGKFTMPASDVTVSGTFSKIDYTITKTESGRGSIVAKKGDATVETAQIGDEITLSATPNEGYEFISWTVVDSKGNSVEVRDNKFTMPASNVTVSATFNSTASYTVSFSVNGNVTTKSYKETEKIEFPDVPAQDGVKFMGWATSDFSGIVSSKPELVDVNRAVMGTNDITYYAVFGVIETAVFDPNDLSATPAVSDQSLTWKHTATGVTLKLSAGQLYTGTPKTFTVNGGNNFQISSDKNYIISEIETTLSESKYKINSVSSGATLSISGTTQTVKSDNLTVIKCNATSSNQIRATKITVTALTGYSTKIISLIAVAVSGTPTKTEYTVGETFDPKGLTVTGTYSNGDSAQISDGISWTCTPSTFDASGNRTVKVIATVKSIPSAEYNVNVTVNTIYNTLAATDKSINVNTNLDVKTLFTTNSNAEIKYTLVENPSDAGTLTGTTFSATAAGTYTVKASQVATDKYSAAEATATITVTTAPLTKSYTIQFATATSDSNSAMTESTKVSDIVSSGSEYVSGFTSSCKKAYKGKNGVKLGSSSGAGTLEFTLKDLVKNNVVSIKVTTVKYGSDSSTITMYDGSTSLKSNIGDGEETYEFNTPTSVSSLKFVSTQRQYISAVVITCKQ